MSKSKLSKIETDIKEFRKVEYKKVLKAKNDLDRLNNKDLFKVNMRNYLANKDISKLCMN